MSLSFAEAAKGSTSLMSQVIGRVIQQTSPIAEYISVRDTGGHRTYTWFNDKDPGSVTWTSVNQILTTSSTGEIQEFIVAVSRVERFMLVDKGLAKIPKRGEELKVQQVRLAGIAFGLEFTNTFFSGSATTNPRQPNGIANIVRQMVSRSTMPSQQQLNVGGGPWTLATMADLQTRVWPDEDGCFYMNRDMFLYYNTLIRDASAAGYYRIEEDRSMFGKPISTFNGWPVRIIMRTDNYQTPLGFTENGLDLTGGITTSVWAVSHDADMGVFCVAEGGIGMTAGPFVDLQVDSQLRSHTMMEYAYASGGPRSAARAYGVAQPS